MPYSEAGCLERVEIGLTEREERVPVDITSQAESGHAIWRDERSHSGSEVRCIMWVLSRLPAEMKACAIGKTWRVEIHCIKVPYQTARTGYLIAISLSAPREV